MAPLFDPHHPWVFTFGILGNIVSFLVYFAPVPTFIQIYKSKSTLGFHSVPYVVALFSAMLWMYYAFLKKDAILMITINSFGCIIETIYITIFFIYASKENRKKAAKLFVGLNVVFFSAILLFTLFLIKGRYRLQVVGWICVGIAVSVFAAPLSILLQVVKTKSIEFLPFNLSFFLTLNAIMWFFYGLLQKDWCITLPNVFGFFLGMVQMFLYGIYRNPTEKVAVEKGKGMQEQVINITMVGNSTDQIHPMDCTKSGSCDNEVVVEVGKKDINEKTDDEEEEVRQESTTSDDEDLGIPHELVEPKPNEYGVATTPPLVTCAAA